MVPPCVSCRTDEAGRSSSSAGSHNLCLFGIYACVNQFMVNDESVAIRAMTSRRPAYEGRGLMRLVRVTSLSVALLPFLAGGPALAAGFMVRENSAESLGMIYAGDASRADEAATVFNNPAGMMHLAGPEVELGAAVVFPSVHFSGSATAAGTIPIPGNQGGEAGQITGIPDFYAVFGLSDNLRAGLAVTAPFGDTINYKSMFVGRYQGIKTLALSADINPNIAWRINDTVSVAAGVSAQWLKLEQSAAIPQFLIFQNPAAPDASFLFNGTNWGFGYNLGLLLEPNTTTRLGFTWRSGVDHKQSGSLDFTGANPALGLTNGSATAAGLDLPGTAAVSFTHDWSPEFTGSAELQYNTWSSFKQVTITSATSPLVQPEHYRNSWMISAGGIYHATSQLSLRAGVGWDQTPVTDQYRTVGVPDSDRFMIGAGIGYAVAPGAIIDFGYGHYFGFTNPPIGTSVNSIDPLTHAIALTGTYHNFLDFVALSFRYAL
jgi:long-chain fatty acid transport protein